MIVNPLDENKKRLEEQAKKEAKALEERIRLQKEQAGRLKIGTLKRELEEIKRRVSLKTSEKNRLVLELNDLKNKERATGQSTKDLGSAVVKETDVLKKKREKEEAGREIELFEMEIEQKKKERKQNMERKRNEIKAAKNELDKINQQAATVAAEPKKLEQQLIPSKSLGMGGGKKLATEIETKRKIEERETRIRIIKEEIKKLEFEKNELEKEIRRIKELTGRGSGEKEAGGEQNTAQRQNKINAKKRELGKLSQQTTSVATKLNELERELSVLENQGPSLESKDEIELTKKINRKKEIERELEALERNKNLSRSQTDSIKRTMEELKRKIKEEEGRLTGVEQELQKLTAEQNRIEQEIRGL